MNIGLDSLVQAVSAAPQLVFNDQCFDDARRRIRDYLKVFCPASDLLDEVAGCAVDCARRSNLPVAAILDHLAEMAGIGESELRSKGDAGREPARARIEREMERARATRSLAAAPPAASTEDDDAEEAAVASPLKADCTLADLTHPPGLVGAIVDWMEASAEFPSRELALGAALGWVSALGGRGYKTPSRARTNLYLVALAPSGYGKDHAASCTLSLAQAVGLERFIGPAKFMSATALRESLIAQPTMLAIQDEFGGIMRQINGPKVGIHNEMIRTDLLALFSRSKDYYAGAAYAQTQAVKLHNPNLCIYGTSTPADFWPAVTSDRTADGFLPRFILFSVDGPKPARVRPVASSEKPPAALVEASRAIYTAVYGSGNLAGMLQGTVAQDAREVPLTDDAQAVLAAFGAKIEAVQAKVEDKLDPLVSRAYEHALKLALTVAIGVDPVKPIIDHEAMTWAAGLAWHSLCALGQEIERHVSDNDRQRDFKRLIEIVRKEGKSGITRSILLRKLGATMDKRRRDELIEEAKDMNLIDTRLVQPPRGRPSARYVAL